MFSWRARIGLVKPTHRGKAFAFWYTHALPGVEFVPTFIGFRSGTRETFTDQSNLQRAEDLATDLKAVGCEFVAISGSPPFLLRGAEFEAQWGQGLSARIGVPVGTGMRPHALALAGMGVKRVAVATYYGDELNDAIVRYFSSFGIESDVIPGFRLSGESEGLYATPLMALDGVGYEQVYRHCKLGVRALGERVDALYINGGGWDVAPVVDYLEQDLGIPVVWALAAEMWHAYRTLGLRDPIDGCGRLLRDPIYRPLHA